MIQKRHIILILIFLSQFVSAHESLPELEDLNGQYHNMSNYIGKGQWVLVNVWSPTCTWCVRELPKIQQFNRDNTPNILTLGVTLDYPSFEYGKSDITKAFLEETALNYPIFLADLDSASQLIGNRLVGIPQTTIFHPDGRAVARWAGDIELEDIYNFIENFDEHYHQDPFREDTSGL